MNKIILIGGAPTIGKSFIARKISEQFKIPWVSTDTIREMMRKIVREEDFPKLFRAMGFGIDAEEYLSTRTPQQIVEGQNAESIDVWKGVEAIIDTDYVWEDLIIEGVHVLPEFVGKINKSVHKIKTIFLVDENEERVRNVVYTRGLADDADTYPDSVKEVEVQWVDLFNKYILDEVEKYGFKCYEIGDRNSFIKSLSQELKEWLLS